MEIAERIKKGKDFRLISINPDVKDFFGHYLAFDERMKEDVLGANGDFLTLGNNKLLPEIEQEYSFIAPTFSDNSWALRREDNVPAYMENFKGELTGAVKEIEAADGTTKNIFYMYLAHPRHIPLVLDVAREAGQGHEFILNIFWAHFDFFNKGKIKDPGKIEPEVLDCIVGSKEERERLGVKLCVDSPQLRSAMQKCAGEDMPVQPMFSVTEFSENELDPGCQVVDMHKAFSSFIVYYPGIVRVEKGFDLLSGLVQKSAKKGGLSRFKFRFRMVRSTGLSKKIWKLIGRNERMVDQIRGVLDADEYKRLFKEADIILIPYRKSEFYSRTSAVLSDSIILGKPVVATADTWAGDHVRDLGIGETFADGNVNDFVKALDKVAANYDHYLQNAIEARKRWLEENNVKNFVSFIREQARVKEKVRG